MPRAPPTRVANGHCSPQAAPGWAGIKPRKAYLERTYSQSE